MPYNDPAAETAIDPTVPTRADWDARFETEAGKSWHATLLG